VKPAIHPNYSEATITCACGNVIKTYSAQGSFTIDVCSQCHPFYTGRQKLVDTAGRVDRFRKRYAAHSAAQSSSVKPGTEPKA